MNRILHFASLYVLFHRTFSSNDGSYLFQEGKVGGGNSTRFELASPIPMRIVLHSLLGDADLYVSYNTPNVSYKLEEHDISSTTCGLDYIDIPALPRPAYLSIYGHPSYQQSEWRMVVIMGKESIYSRGDFQLEPEFIYEWEAHQSNEEHTYSGFAELIGDILEIIVEILLT